jgi:ribosomal protein L7/L12
MTELDRIVDQLSKLSVMEAADLVKKLKKIWVMLLVI